MDDVLHESPSIVETRARLPHIIAFLPSTPEPPCLQNPFGGCQGVVCAGGTPSPTFPRRDFSKSALPGSKCNRTTSLRAARCFWRNPNPPGPNPAQDPTSGFCVCRVRRSCLPSSHRLMLSRAFPDSSDAQFPCLRCPRATGQLAQKRKFRGKWGSRAGVRRFFPATRDSPISASGRIPSSFRPGR